MIRLLFRLLPLLASAWALRAAEPLAHWAYQPVVRPTLPTVKQSAWPRTDLDRFILAKLEAKGLQPSPEADPRTLIRRLYFDLLGLPPAPEEVETFVREFSLSHSSTVPPAIGESEKARKRESEHGAVARLVDRLLASPHYGERWARHWLDIAHYADTHGFERDQLRPNAWHYRDYVIASLNADKPYDQFLREQIAGDVLAEGSKVQGPRSQVQSRRSRSDQGNRLSTLNFQLSKPVRPRLPRRRPVGLRRAGGNEERRA